MGTFAARVRGRRPLLVTGLALALTGALVGCGGGSASTDSTVPVPEPASTEEQPTQESPTDELGTAGSEADGSAEDDGYAPEASAEIWQWALGRNVWDDPSLANLASSLGASSSTAILAQPYGFQLVLDSSGNVTKVVLYNDETALGLPVSDTSFSAYPGALPADLSWDDTIDTVVARYGAGEEVLGGWGTEYTHAYQTEDGLILEVAYVAKHENELPGSPLHTITLRLPS